MRRSLTVCILLAMVITVGFAQGRHKRRKDKQFSTQQQPNSLNPYYPVTDYAPQEKMSKSAVRNSGITFDQEVQAYYDRKAKVLKEEAKWERISKRPQYSDPSYFGHKHKPKKHPPGKMKYCKECGIWH